MARKHRKNVGIIGLGIIGSRVATALRNAGFHVFVWNRSPRAEPNFLGSPAEVAETCDVIQLFVSDAQALFAVIEDMRIVLSSRHTVICSATVGRDATLDAAELVQETGAAFLDAPFTGSKAAAEARHLVYMTGGTDETSRRAEPILRASSKEIVHVGAIGDAAVVKIATNMLAAVTVQALSECLALVQDAGIAPARFEAVLEKHGARSGVTDAKLPKMIAGDFETHFALKHMFKDVQLGIQLANALSIEIPATATTAGVIYGALNRGWADLDFSVLSKLYQDERSTLIEGFENVEPEIEPLESVDAFAGNLPVDPASGESPAAGEDVAPFSAPAGEKGTATEPPPAGAFSESDEKETAEKLLTSDDPSAPNAGNRAGFMRWFGGK